MQVRGCACGYVIRRRALTWPPRPRLRPGHLLRWRAKRVTHSCCGVTTELGQGFTQPLTTGSPEREVVGREETLTSDARRCLLELLPAVINQSFDRFVRNAPAVQQSP